MIAAVWLPPKSTALWGIPPRPLCPSQRFWVLILQLGTFGDSCSPWHPGLCLADVAAGCRRNAGVVTCGGAAWARPAQLAVLGSWAGGMSPYHRLPAPPLLPPLLPTPPLLVFFPVSFPKFLNSPPSLLYAYPFPS